MALAPAGSLLSFWLVNAEKKPLPTEQSKKEGIYQRFSVSTPRNRLVNDEKKPLPTEQSKKEGIYQRIFTAEPRNRLVNAEKKPLPTRQSKKEGIYQRIFTAEPHIRLANVVKMASVCCIPKEMPICRRKSGRSRAIRSAFEQKA